MDFRPLPVLTVLAIPALAALLYLGTWQARRAPLKAGLNAEYGRAAAAGPLPPEDAVCSRAKEAPAREELYRPIDGASVVKLLGAWPPAGSTVRMFGQDAAGNAGWRHLIQVAPPACLAEQGGLVVEGPFEPFVPGEAAPAVPTGPAPARYMAAEWPAKPAFAAANSPETNDWHWFDRAGMERAFGAAKLNDRIYLAVMPGTLPAHLSRTPPATHIGYSVTWYGMAIALLVIYALF